MSTPKNGTFESGRSGKITERDVKHRASETVRSRNPAGGEVPRSDYAGKTPIPADRADGAKPHDFNK